MSFGRKLLQILPAFLLLLGMVGMQAGTVQAAGAKDVEGLGLFQLDGNPQTCLGPNAAQNNSPSSDDWQNALAGAKAGGSMGIPAIDALPSACTAPSHNSTTNPAPSAATFVQDGSKRGAQTDGTNTIPADTTFLTGGNTKDICNFSGTPNPCSSGWLWSTTSTLQDKDDIMNAGAVAYTVPNGDPNADPSLYGHTIVYFTMDRFDNSGDSDVGFWFTQQAVGTNSGGTFSGQHTNGDILVLSNFGQGGSQPQVQVFMWSNGALSGAHTFSGGGSTEASCGSNGGVDQACAIVNATTLNSVWPMVDKSGNKHTYLQNEFFEGGIDLTALEGGTTPCLSSFLAETRSSTSTTATLKDFALGGFQTCHAQINLTPASAANQAGNIHPITATVQYAQGAGSFANAPDGTTVNLTLTNSQGAAASFCTTSSCATLTSPGTSTSCTTVGGQCTVYLVSQTTGKVRVDGTSSFTVGGQPLMATTTGCPNSAATCNVPVGAQGFAQKWFVNGNIAIDNSSVNEVGHSHTFTITVNQDVGDGTSFHPASGVTVNTSISGDTSGGGSIIGGTCGSTTPGAQSGSGTTGSGGTCTVTVVSPNPGTITLTATTSNMHVTAAGCSNPPAGFTCSPLLSPQPSVTGSGTSGNGQKRFVDAAVTITPLTPTNAVNNAETFTVTVFQNDGTGTGWVRASSASVTRSILTDTTPGHVASITGGTCTGATGHNDLTNGQCTIIINSPKAGQVTVQASAALTVSGVSLVRTTGGTNAACDPSTLAASAPGCNSPNAVKTYVDAAITITPGTATNAIGQTHTLTVQLYQNLGDGNGFVPAGSGITVTTSIVRDTTAGTVGHMTTPQTCGAASGTTGSGTTDNNGQCTVSIVSSQVGEIDVSATATFSVTPANGNASQPITVTTDGTGNLPNSPPAVKHFVAGEIDLTKHVQIGVLTAAPNVCYTLSYDSANTGSVVNPISTDTGTNATGGVYTFNSTANSMTECYQYPANTTGAFESDVSYTFSWHNVGVGTFAIHEVVTPSPPYTANADLNSANGDAVVMTRAQIDTMTPLIVTPQHNPLPPGALRVTKKINGGTVPIPNGATFTFHVYACGTGSTATSCVLPQNPTDIAGANGLQITGDGTSLTLSADLGSLQEGYYEVFEDPNLMPSCCTIDPTAGNNPQILAVAAGSLASSNVATVNNLRLLKMIIFTCDMQNNLVTSQSTLSNAPDGQTGTINTGPTNLSTLGVTAAQACQLAPANYQKLQPSTTYNPVVTTGH